MSGQQRRMPWVLERRRRPRATARARWDLRFDDGELERRFVERDDAASLPRGRVAAGFGIVVWGAFALIDPQVATDYDGSQLALRAAVAVWLAVLTLGAQRPALRRFHPFLLCSAPIAVGWALDAMAIRYGEPMALVVGGNMLSAIALFALIGVRVRISIPTGVLLLAGFVVAAAVEGGSWPLLVSNVLFVTGALGFGIVAAYLLETLRRRALVDELALAEERARSDRLLHNVLPEAIAARLRADPRAIAEAQDEVSVVFADIIGSTRLATELEPDVLVGLLDELFTAFDGVCRRHGVEKIKTIGDAYMAVAGLPRPDAEHAVAAAEVARGWLEVARGFERWPGGLSLRVGISSGPVVAGVIGRDKFAYDLWGDTVNTASRMEANGRPGRVQVSDATYRLLRDAYGFEGPYRIDVKGKGEMVTWLLDLG